MRVISAGKFGLERLRGAALRASPARLAPSPPLFRPLAAQTKDMHAHRDCTSARAPALRVSHVAHRAHIHVQHASAQASVILNSSAPRFQAVSRMAQSSWPISCEVGLLVSHPGGMNVRRTELINFRPSTTPSSCSPTAHWRSFRFVRRSPPRCVVTLREESVRTLASRQSRGLGRGGHRRRGQVPLRRSVVPVVKEASESHDTCLQSTKKRDVGLSDGNIIAVSDGNIIAVGTRWFRCPDMLCQPSFCGKETANSTTPFFQSVMRSTLISTRIRRHCRVDRAHGHVLRHW